MQVSTISQKVQTQAPVSPSSSKSQAWKIITLIAIPILLGLATGGIGFIALGLVEAAIGLGISGAAVTLVVAARVIRPCHNATTKKTHNIAVKKINSDKKPVTTPAAVNPEQTTNSVPTQPGIGNANCIQASTPPSTQLAAGNSVAVQPANNVPNKAPRIDKSGKNATAVLENPGERLFGDLNKAIEARDAAMVEQLLDGLVFNIMHEQYLRLIYRARAIVDGKQQHGNLGNARVILSLLIKHAEDINETEKVPSRFDSSKTGDTLLIKEIKTKCAGILFDCLLEEKPDVNIKNNAGETALSIAISKELPIEIIQKLLANGADINIKAAGEFRRKEKYPLSIAAAQEKEDVFMHLLRYKPAEESFTEALRAAAMNGRTNKVKTLLTYKHDPVVVLKLLIKLPPDSSYEEIAHLLLESVPNKIAVQNKDNQPANFDPLKIQDQNGDTLLHKAVKKKRPNAVAALLRKKADIAKRNLAGDLPTDLIADVPEEDIEIRNRLAAMLMPLDPSGETLLHKAVRRGKVDLVAALLRKRVDVTVKNKDGKTALNLLENVSDQIVQKQIKEMIDVNKTDEDGNTPLYRAIIARNVGLVKTYLAIGALIDIENKDGKTAFDLSQGEIRGLIRARGGGMAAGAFQNKKEEKKADKQTDQTEKKS